jgi:hypothetical protein
VKWGRDISKKNKTFEVGEVHFEAYKRFFGKAGRLRGNGSVSR